MNPSNFLRSSTFRLSLFYVGLFVLSVLLLFIFIYWSTAQYMKTQTNSLIIDETQSLAARYRDRGLPGLRHLIHQRIDQQRPTGTSIYLLTDSHFQVIIGNINRWPDVTEEDGWLRFELVTDPRNRASQHPILARQYKLARDYRLLVGKDIHELEHTRLRIIKTLAWGLLLTLALALVGGIVMSRRLLVRIDQINETSRQIMDGDLSQRITQQGSNDEFDQLADNLNRMLNQIEVLMENTRRVSDNIAHDLRTPLSHLRQELETLKNNQLPGQFGHEHLDNALHEADQLLNTFSAVLRIARIESGSERQNLTQLDLSDLIGDVVELYEPLAEAKQQHLVSQIQTHTTITGDRDMLFQAFANLLDNAIKYTSVGGIISVRCTQLNDKTCFSVSDSGPGIDLANQDRVFERFYRQELSRSLPGNGLGLSLVRAVADLHAAHIELTNSNPGLNIQFTLPNTPSDG